MARKQPARGSPPAELLYHSRRYRVVICTVCNYAVPRPGIAWHLKEMHSMSPSDRKPYLDFVAGLDICPPNQVVPPTVEEFPVPQLPVLDGLQCTSSGCNYLCTSEKRLKNHFTNTHKSEQQAFRRVPVQTFFRGNKLSYFTGSSTSSLLKTRASHSILPLRSVQSHTLFRPVPTSTSCQSRSPVQDPLTLLRHYQRSTFKTIADGTPVDEKLWRDVIFQIAHEHEFLLHGLLAFTCLHLAYLNPGTRNEYLIKAGEYQSKAMPQFREAIARPTDGNCHAILAFSSLLIPYSFASEQQDELFLASDNDTDAVPTWLYFIRNGCITLCDQWDKVESGPCGTLAKAWDKPFETRTPEQAVYLEDMHAIMDASVGEHAWPHEVREAYREAAAELAMAFACSQSDPENYTTWDALRVWPMRISMTFTRLLRDSHPAALILLAHYAILLKPIESKWYFKGRATKLLETISRKVDPHWHFALPGL
ncbi:hypothetical protein PV08_03220 [Exophiala spinifera]|uniref:C2H2-type domain-containing protein n=1 Tax=Exophiala spinifera TaxID=91928 RepID=A0A0D1YUJ8_9EURO|nr:uncharacterized protein PV08_03220 [Exophiala spinifera]KIW18931.1 hypothetical protein PV08_03220 [Exophiala spinifera]